MTIITHAATAKLPTRYGNFTLHGFKGADSVDYVALSHGKVANGCLVRIHSECATGDIFGSQRCDCRDQLDASMERIAASDNGLLIYLRGHEGRGIGLANKVKAYALQDRGMDTVEANTELGFQADQRDYQIAVSILKYFHLGRIRLLTNNREKLGVLEDAGIRAEHVPLWMATNPHNEKYVATKRGRMGHIN